MLRKERVWHTLNDLCRGRISDKQLANQDRVGFTTLELASLLMLDRANTSRDLNQLVDEGRVIKLAGKPVLYLDRTFLEEYLGQPIKVTHDRVNSLSALHPVASSSAVSKLHSEPHHASTSTAVHYQRAVRWLDLPDDNDEASYITVANKTYNLGLLVVAYGHSTASSMTDAACRLTKLERSNVVALDVEPDDEFDVILSEAELMVKHLASSHPDGVLLLVDLPNLAALQANISQRNGLKHKVVENVNTGMVVSALQSIHSGRYSLEELANYLRHQNDAN